MQQLSENSNSVWKPINTYQTSNLVTTGLNQFFFKFPFLSLEFLNLPFLYTLSNHFSNRLSFIFFIYGYSFYYFIEYALSILRKRHSISMNSLDNFWSLMISSSYNLSTYLFTFLLLWLSKQVAFKIFLSLKRIDKQVFTELVLAFFKYFSYFVY